MHRTAALPCLVPPTPHTQPPVPPPDPQDRNETLFYRVLRHTQIGGGTSEIQRILIARKLLGK